MSDIEKLRGDIHHLVSPIIGILRRVNDDFEFYSDLLAEWLPHYVERLSLVLDLMDEAAGVGQVPDHIRARQGMAPDRYPSLPQGDSSPCLSGTHVKNQEKE